MITSKKEKCITCRDAFSAEPVRTEIIRFHSDRISDIHWQTKEALGNEYLFSDAISSNQGR